MIVPLKETMMPRMLCTMNYQYTLTVGQPFKNLVTLVRDAPPTCSGHRQRNSRT